MCKRLAHVLATLISGAAAGSMWLAAWSPVWFSQEIDGNISSYFHVFEGIRSTPHTALDINSKIVKFTYHFCPGLHQCNDFSWGWGEDSVWMTIDDITGSCMRFEVVLMRWGLPLLWSVSSAMVTSSSAVLALGILKPLSTELQAFCGKLCFLAGASAIMIILTLLSLDLFNTDIWMTFYGIKEMEFLEEFEPTKVIINIAPTDTFYKYNISATLLSLVATALCYAAM